MEMKIIQDVNPAREFMENGRGVIMVLRRAKCKRSLKTRKLV